MCGVNHYLCGSKIASIGKSGETVSYTYDAGLVTSETLSGTLDQTLSYGYNNDFNPISFTYDHDGLLTGSGNFSITRNSQNDLPEAVSDGHLNIGGTFNGYAEIASQTQAVYGQNIVSWTLERNDNGRITRKTETAAGTTATYDYTYNPMGTLLTVTQNGSTYYLAYDQVGSLRVVADGAGNLVKTIDYDSFGNILSDTNPSFEVPFGFAGDLHDRDTGLVRFGFRDCDPEIGRWTSKDPIFFAGGDTDLYRYVLNDPVNMEDPWGLFPPTNSQDNNIINSYNHFNSGGGMPNVDIPWGDYWDSTKRLITNPISWVLISQGADNLVKGTKLATPVGIGMEILGLTIGADDISDSSIPNNLKETGPCK